MPQIASALRTKATNPSAANGTSEPQSVGIDRQDFANEKTDGLHQATQVRSGLADQPESVAIERKEVVHGADRAIATLIVNVVMSMAVVFVMAVWSWSGPWVVRPKLTSLYL
jgi:hypothetical protein